MEHLVMRFLEKPNPDLEAPVNGYWQYRALLGGRSIELLTDKGNRPHSADVSTRHSLP